MEEASGCMECYNHPIYSGVSMRHLLVLACLSMATLVASAVPTHAAVADEIPTVEPGFVLHPTFLSEKSSFTAGTGFVLKVDENTVVVTAYHLFGPAGGIPKVIAPEDLPGQVREVILRDPWSSKVAGRAAPAWLLADAAPMDVDPSRDLVVFPVKKASATDLAARLGDGIQLSAHELADSSPSVGDVIFLAGFTSDEGRRERRTFPGGVVEVTPGGFYYALQDADLNLAGFNGAPILTPSGKVIGMHLGGGKMEDGTLIGVANPVDSLRTRIQKAAPATP
jgi:hypothetical protein